ncbi:MAG: DNA polymerase, partial [Chloroflexia bacterium]
MTTYCPNCQHWTPIPADLGAAQGNAPAMPKCEHCGTALPVEGRYALCGDCGRIHRTDYELCPFKVEGVAVGAPKRDAAAALYSVEAQKRRPKKRSDDYYWQLYFDYRDKAEESSDFPVPPSEVMGEEPPHPADAGGYVPSSNGNGNGAGNGHSNGNGRDGYANGNANGNAPRSAPQGNGSNKPVGNGYSKGNGNGYSNSNGNGYGRKPQSTRVDLKIAEIVPVTLFPETEFDIMPDANAALAAGESGEAGEAKTGAGNFNDFEYELINDPSRLAEVAELLSQEKVVGLDTETTGLDPYTSELLLLQVSTFDKVYIVDCRRVVPLALKGMLENPGIMKVAQNAKFEYVMLRQQAGITVNNFFDTMLAEKLLMAGIGREVSLKVIAQKYIGATLDKSVRESFYKLTMHGDAYLAPEQLHYAARDAFIMIPIWQRQLPELKKHKLMQVAELEFRCVPAVGDLELAGVQIDVTRWRKIISDVGVQRDTAAGELSELLAPATMQATMFGVPAINLNSGSQLMEAFATLGVHLPDTMEASLVKFDHPAVAKLLEYRQHEKTLSAFGENVLALINPKTGRIHPSFQQYGADTGRFSCTRPNVQQIPATSDFRKCFIAAPGYKLVT